MTTETTQSATTASRPISGQRAAVKALADLIDQFASLPEAHITIHEPFRLIAARIDLQLTTPQEFETWRAALQINPDVVEVHATTSHSWLAADTWFEGVKVHIAGFGVPLTPEDAVADRTVDTAAVTA